MNETRTLAQWVSGLDYEHIPEKVREAARQFILDNFGCQIAGATLPWSQSYYDVIRRTRSGVHSTVAYFGDKLAPDDAAFVNSTFNHANETDDTHLKSPTHPGGTAVPYSESTPQSRPPPACGRPCSQRLASPAPPPSLKARRAFARCSRATTI